MPEDRKPEEPGSHTLRPAGPEAVPEAFGQGLAVRWNPSERTRAEIDAVEEAIRISDQLAKHIVLR